MADDMDFGDLVLRPAKADQHGRGHIQSTKDSEENSWADLDLSDQCQKAMHLLTSGERQWDNEPGDVTVPVLEQYKKIALTRRDERDKSTPTALHLIAKDYKKQYKNVPEEIMKKVLKYLLDERDLSPPEEEPILKIAMKYNNSEFIDCVMDCWPDGFPDLLDIQDSNKQNFLHIIFDVSKLELVPPPKKEQGISHLQQFRNQTLERARKFVPRAKPQTLAAKDKDGNTPIHYAMDYRQCWGRKEPYVETFKDMVLKGDELMKTEAAFNNDDESPILFFKRTERKVLEYRRERQEIIAARQPAVSEAPPGGQARVANANGPAQPKPPSAAEPEDDGEVAEEETDRVGKRTVKESKTSYLRSTVNHSRSFAETTPAEANRTHSGPPTEHQSPTHKNVKSPAARDEVDEEWSKNTVLEFLILHYIRTRPDLEARELIYGKNASAKNLYFDASGLRLRGAHEITKLIDRMSVGGFENTLAYVSLPSVAHTKDTESVTKPPSKTYPKNLGLVRQSLRPENPKIGRTALIDVFKKLHENGVNRILRLQVEDRESPSHTDAAIETALRGMDSLSETSASPRCISVETWDWRKPDLSMDVIAFAAPDVEHVNLYWSGNQTVLRGWGCPKGIGKLDITTKGKLKTVTVHAAPGLETRHRMEKQLEYFKADVKNNTENKIEPTVNYLMSGLLPDFNEDNDDSGGATEEGKKQHDWIQQMEEFRTALNSIHKELRISGKQLPERVKVALIDDGVELGNLETYNGQVEVNGVSYYPRTGQSERPWHRSSRGHGTVMAMMITRVNPWVSLYVMRLRDGTNSDGGRTIFAETAARAIRGAIGLKVDIISMSWTVKKKIASAVAPTVARNVRDESAGAKTSYEEQAIRMLEEAIDAAVKAKILMFCSASDDIKSGGLDTLPYSQAPGYIFRIGASLSQGERDTHTEDMDQINYFFPGNQVAEALNPKSAGNVKYYDGSSVATALAAGLASLILYCAILMQWHHKGQAPGADSKSYERFKTFVDALKQRDGMKRAFNNIESDIWKDRKYLPVWAIFGPKTKKIEEAEGEKKWESLEELVTDLCSKITSAVKRTN